MSVNKILKQYRESLLEQPSNVPVVSTGAKCQADSSLPAQSPSCATVQEPNQLADQFSIEKFTEALNAALSRELNKLL